MNIFYKKNKNDNLFSDIKNYGVQEIQNYIPIYKRFFSLSEKNYNIINLNNVNFIDSIVERNSENLFVCNVVKDISCSEITSRKKDIFIKFSPLLDPLKYMRGIEKIDMNNILPTFQSEETTKIYDYNNSSYVDSFFYFIISKLLNEKQFIHGIDFYGSYLAIKENFLYNAEDEGEYLYESDFFKKNIGSLFDIVDCEEKVFTRNNKEKLSINDFNILLDVEDIECDVSMCEQEDMETLFVQEEDKNDNISECSSTMSNSDDDDDDDDDSSDDEVSSEASSIETVEDIICNIHKFPVQLIAIEKCDNTFDSLLEEGMSDDELTSAIFQVLIMLITYKELFSFTHNDLHTNNIMYKKTDKQYLYYKWLDKHYKVPTFGRIFKIIDFGRSIYKYDDKLFCSDSFHPKGDAATQYNFEPYYNPKKDRVEPNYSFDLCRLGCSMYDLLEENESDISKLIKNWCLDDNEKNVLYKKNGDERYPDFKLYKMIARIVNKHIPKDVIQNDVFNKYVVSKKKMNMTKIMNINTLIN